MSVSVAEGAIPMEDGLLLYSKTWQPSGLPIAQLAIMHGFSDHAGLYERFATYMCSQHSLVITAFDRRGWGRSVRCDIERGDMGTTPLVLSDLDAAFAYLKREYKSLPLFVMAHSMGGLDLLTYLLSTKQLRSRTAIEGVVLDAPYVALTMRPSRLKLTFGHWLSRLVPKLQISNKPSSTSSTPTGLCRDLNVVSTWLEDDLCHGLGTLEALGGVMERELHLTQLANGESVEIRGLSARLPCSVLWAHGTEDGAVRFDLSEKLYERVSVNHSSRFVAFEQSYHQLHAEPNGIWEQFADMSGKWILERTLEHGQA